ncbi:unnamed protein product [Dicrocoelium dendriticum]|nr:unnamed protein product [Dicrocoelium dendriticum]
MTTHTEIITPDLRKADKRTAARRRYVYRACVPIVCTYFLFISVTSEHANDVPLSLPGVDTATAARPVINETNSVPSPIDSHRQHEVYLAPFHEVIGSHLVDQNTYRCEPINLALCRDMYYQYTRLPNMFDHETQEEAGLEAHQFYPLVQINCAEDLRFFLCSIYIPICVDGYAELLPPCRSVCERVRAGCSPVMQHFNFPWPKRMGCSQFPEYNNAHGALCMERNLNGSGATNQFGKVAFDPQRTHSTQLVDVETERTHVSRRAEFSVDSDEPHNEYASNLLMSAARENWTFRRILEGDPNLQLRCKCGCHSPMIKTTQKENNNNNKTELVYSEGCEMPCHSPHFATRVAFSPVTAWFGVWASLCAMSTILTVATYLLDSHRFKYPELSIIYLSACYLMVSIGYLTRVVLGHEHVACGSIRHEKQYSYASNDNIEAVGFKPQKVAAYSTVSSTNSLTELMVVLRDASAKRFGCALVFVLIYFFSTAASIWWVVLTFTWLLASGMKWGSEAIAKYSPVYHFVAWSIPTLLTTLAFLLAVVGGESVSGLCAIRENARLPHILFVYTPNLLFLLMGVIFLITGFVALLRIRGALKTECMGENKTNGLENLMARIGSFGILYIVPSIVVLICLGYEVRNKRAWELGLACRCGFTSKLSWMADGIKSKPLKWIPPKPDFRVLMLKHFMVLFTGIISGVWVWSQKTLSRWKRFCKRCCFFNFNRRRGAHILLRGREGEQEGSSKTHLVPGSSHSSSLRTVPQRHGLGRLLVGESLVSDRNIYAPDAGVQKGSNSEQTTATILSAMRMSDVGFQNVTSKRTNSVEHGAGCSSMTHGYNFEVNADLPGNSGVSAEYDEYSPGVARCLASTVSSEPISSGFQESTSTNLSSVFSSEIGTGNETTFGADALLHCFDTQLSSLPMVGCEGANFIPNGKWRQSSTEKQAWNRLASKAVPGVHDIQQIHGENAVTLPGNLASRSTEHLQTKTPQNNSRAHNTSDQQFYCVPVGLSMFPAADDIHSTLSHNERNGHRHTENTYGKLLTHPNGFVLCTHR